MELQTQIAANDEKEDGLYARSSMENAGGSQWYRSHLAGHEESLTAKRLKPQREAALWGVLGRQVAIRCDFWYNQ